MTIPMRMPVIMPVAVVMTMFVLWRCRLRGCVPTEVMVVVLMRGSGDDWFRDASLFPQLCPGRHLVVIFSASSLLVGHESFERRFVHVAREWHLRVFHAQRSRILRLFDDDWRRSFMMTIAA